LEKRRRRHRQIDGAVTSAVLRSPPPAIFKTEIALPILPDGRIDAIPSKPADHKLVSIPASPPSIFTLFAVFFRIGLLSFGGGLSGWVFREVVVVRGWINEDEFMSGLAMSQILPGTNISNLAIYIGHKLRGALGACAATVGLLSGPFFAVIAVASTYSAIKSVRFAETAMEGVAAAAIGLLLIIVVRGIRHTGRDPAALAALLATFIGVGLLHWSLVWVAASVGILSVIAAWLRSSPDAG
jgi:chromate transporter